MFFSHIVLLLNNDIALTIPGRRTQADYIIFRGDRHSGSSLQRSGAGRLSRRLVTSGIFWGVLLFRFNNHELVKRVI